MRVYYISSGLEGCYYVRCLLPLQELGYDGDQTSINPETRSYSDKSKAAQASDIVVFHRPEDVHKLELAKILKGMGKKIVFDNDDTAKHDGGFKFNKAMDKERVAKGLKTINATLDEFIGISDLVTTSTEFLADEYRKLNDNVVVLPNCIDPFMFDEPLRNETDIVRIGVTGSIAITDDIDVLKPIVEHYQKDERVRLVIFSLPPNKEDKVMRNLYYHEYKFWDSINVEWQPFVHFQDYYDILNNLRLDIMIIPRADNYFNRCKSNIKFLEASMFEIPVVAQGFTDGKSPYEVNPKDHEHMIIVKDNSQWIPSIDMLIKDKKLRQRMGKKAKKYVKDNYSITNKAKLWKEAYEKIK